MGSTFRVTRAQGRRLYTVNGIPAYDLYDQFLKFPEGESFQSYAMEFPLMLLKGKMRLLRHPLERYSDSSILLDGRVEEGDSICLSYGSPLEIIRKMNERCEKIRAFEPEAILVYSCQGRKSYWGDLVDWELEPFQKVAQTGGACLAGQIMRNNQTGRVIEHRLTLLSVAMREGEKTGRSIPDITVDDDFLKGRMSLVHRMSMLVESTVEGLQKTNSVLREMNERLARANDELHRMAVTDELTGLCNRREIERRIKASLERTQGSKKEISLVMLDIDFFKKVNDTYGHDAGDAVLKDVSAILQECIDESHGEAAGRWGGEEFFVLLPDKGFGEAMALAERIRSVVERHDFPGARHLTVSLGVTCANADTNYQAIFIRADQALYEAKHNGRNRVEGCSAAVCCNTDAAGMASK
ncbi:MAG: diguanylate cyclase [Eggerthellaceae bacterium]|nr:diguanylate cyclase [Eggerthellaceae bacterium]